jgi:hypothetical protein
MTKPPHFAIRLLRWFLAPHRSEELEGDLDELFQQRMREVGLRKARWRYVRDVVSLLRPSLMKREENLYPSPTNTTMLRNYLTIAFRSLTKNRTYSVINIGGLAVGMAVAMLIGFWIWDELSYDKSFANYDRIARVMLQQTDDGAIATSESIPLPLGATLKREYSRDFSYVVLSHQTGEQILAHGANQFLQRGNYVEPEFLEMLPLNLVEGSRTGLTDPASILLSASLAKALFGESDPVNQIVKVNNQLNVKVTGIYEDFPANSTFHEYAYLLPWKQFVADQGWVQRAEDNWTLNAFELFVQLAPNTQFDQLSTRIAQVKATHAPEQAKFNPQLFLHPMSRWHLYSDWENGLPVRGRIQFIWLFGSIGAFVLLLACINFMNLSTARSQKRAKEVGIRKAVGSVRSQLITQFFSESFLVVFFAQVLSIALVAFVLPWFNSMADKQMAIPWSNAWFWGLTLGFSMVTGVIAGSYPAFYLSSFQPIKVLKGTVGLGTLQLGRLAAMPRKVLVVIQFTVSVTLIIGTLLVFRQIQYAKNRPIGYDRGGLLSIRTNTPELIKHYEAIQAELLRTEAVAQMAESSMPTTGVFSSDYNLDWVGKDPNRQVDFDVVACTHDFGKTVGWKIKEGRDFSRDFPTDSVGLIMNESAIKYMGLRNPIGQTVKWSGELYTIIGVIKDMVTNSPFEPVKQTVFKLNYNWVNFITIRLSPHISPHVALEKMEPIFRKYSPGAPFTYRFASDEFTQKFGDEERIGKLASVFASLAILISCLGLFGLASFMAEQRTKEIGVRKVLGASITNLWLLLSKDFVVLVLIAFGLSIPIASYFLNNWLQKYSYRTELSWWIFVVAGLGALSVTLLTVSFQSIKAALMNPVNSLRSE